jgi:hypothetical protein
MATRAKAKPAKPRITRATIEKAGPSRAKLRELVKRSRPPQSWYDEDGGCPFVPQKR